MSEISEQEQQTLNTGRLLRDESSSLLPLLQVKQTQVLAKIVQAFKAGKHETYLGYAAELNMIYDMKTEITNKIRQAENIEQKLYGNDNEEGQ